MEGLAEAALRFRDAAVPALFGFAGPLGAIASVVVLLMRGSIGQPPAPEYLAIALVAVVIGMLMIWARWLISAGRPATATIGALAVIHALAGALCARAALGEHDGGGASAGLAVYGLSMACLLAWCARVPIGIGRGGGG